MELSHLLDGKWFLCQESDCSFNLRFSSESNYKLVGNANTEIMKSIFLHLHLATCFWAQAACFLKDEVDSFHDPFFFFLQNNNNKKTWMLILRQLDLSEFRCSLIKSLRYEKVSNFIKEFIFAEISEPAEISETLRAYL